jgi:uncharacterized protein involved in cysteine biosynthesis
MRTTGEGLLLSFGHLARTVAATLVAGLWRRMNAEQVEARLKALPARDQAGLVGGVLGLMLLCSLFAAQFGILGMLAFWLVVILLVR